MMIINDIILAEADKWKEKIVTKIFAHKTIEGKIWFNWNFFIEERKSDLVRRKTIEKIQKWN